jgi:hypothetical protein
MIARHVALLLLGAVTLCSESAPASAQDFPAPPKSKTIGVATTAKPEVVPSMIVLNAQGAALEGRTPTLDGVSLDAIMFADRPVGAAGHALTARLLEEWTGGNSCKRPA